MTYEEKDKNQKPDCPYCGENEVIQVFNNVGFIKGNKGNSNPPPFCGPSRGCGCCG